MAGDNTATQDPKGQENNSEVEFSNLDFAVTPGEDDLPKVTVEKLAPDADADEGGQKKPEEGKGKEGEPKKDADGKDDDTADDKANRPSRAKRRINRLTREANDAKREAARLRDENQRLKAEKSKPAEVPKPNAEDYEDHDAYVEALADWKADQKIKARESEADKGKPDDAGKDQDAPVLTEQQQSIYNATVAAIEDSEHKDFEDVVFNKDVPLTETMIAQALEFDPEGELLYQLAKNADVVEEIANMKSVGEVARAIGRFEASLNAGEGDPPPPKKSSSAPDPIEPVGGAGGSDSRSDDELSFAEFEKRRNQQDVKAGRSIY